MPVTDQQSKGEWRKKVAPSKPAAKKKAPAKKKGAKKNG